MKNRLRHGIYWVVVAITIIPILYAISGVWLHEHIEPLYGKLRSWTHQDKYGRRSWD